MTDTPQPSGAGETVADPIAVAAEAFKVSLGQTEPSRRRDEQGRFASPAEQAEAQENEIEADEPEAEAEGEAAESHDEPDETEEAAEEAQPDDAPLPTSWPAEMEETWKSLPAEVQGKIVEREAERDAAVNTKFQEAANARKASEALIAQANANRANYTQALDTLIQLVQPEWPSPTMLDYDSSDYDPDTYHLKRAQAEQSQVILQNLAAQRQHATAQEQQELAQIQQQRNALINKATLPALEQAYPEIKDRAKAEKFLSELMEYAVKMGAPSDIFDGSITAVEWHILADAKRWNDHKAALNKVKTEAKPEPRKAQPALRPGVTTPKSAVKRAEQQKAFDRLARSGSIEDGAAIWKSFLTG